LGLSDTFFVEETPLSFFTSFFGVIFLCDWTLIFFFFFTDEEE
jgi:hypothetical protein